MTVLVTEQVYTPEPAADQLIDAAQLERGITILEPSAGRGHLARKIRERMLPGCRLICLDIDDEAVEELPDGGATVPPPINVNEIDLCKVGSVRLRELIEEVRNEQNVPQAYNRMHNRHNRSR